MVKNKYTPEIRFPGFTTCDWEKRKLGELAEFNPKSSLPEQFEYVDLESVIGTTMVSHRMEKKDTAPSRAQRLAQKGDVFYQTVRPYQKNNYLFDLPYDNYVFSTGYAQLRPNINSYFLLSRLQEERFVSIVLDRSTGTSYPAINSNDLAQIKMGVPSEQQEQTKIGNFFKQLDDTIALYQQELITLKQTKQGFLQKMFPKEGESVPEVRFPGFTGDWKLSKLSDFLSSLKSGLSRMLSNQDIGLPVIRANNINNGILDIDNDIKYWYIDDPQGANTQNYLIHKNDILVNFINSEAKMGTAAIVDSEPKRPTIYTTNILNLRTNQDANPYFIYSLTMTEKYKNYIKTITKPAVNQASFTTVDFKRYEFLAPTIQEQIKIGKFFKQLDDMIVLHQRELDALKETKKAFLQKMFA
ncbi:restriction endonuclease subunit S [Bacillus paranthracis]|nr:restriction endonuclease subunit S [Bacillus paranthracis]